jgi:hypothetical protein
MTEAIDIRELIERIGKLNKKEKVHILNILKPNDKDYTQNANGYFFNLANVPDDVIKKILRCLHLIEKNRNILQEMDERRESLVNYYKGLIEDKLKCSISEIKSKYIKQITLRSCQSNVNMHVKRRLFIKRKNYISDANIDDVIKEHMKGYKYEKDSVYYRLNYRMKSLRAGRETKGKSDEMEENDEEDVKQVQIQSDCSEQGNEDEQDECPEYEDFDFEEVKSVASDASDQSTTSRNTETETECFTDKLTYYKRLLNTKGFKFDDNKHCNLVKEPYIV